MYSNLSTVLATYPNVVVTSKEGKRAKVGRTLIILTGNVGKSGTRSGWIENAPVKFSQHALLAQL
jgi:hypothetical protein